MKHFIQLICLLLITAWAKAQPCDSIIAPQLSENTRKDLEQKLAEARSAYEKDSNNADALIWYGRRTAYLGNYMQAIDIYSRGISIHRGDARFYRHRAHRYITVRCFDKAVDDLKKAASLVKGKADETEPDGLPNAKNIPTSTLQSNIWYHLGLAYFLKGKYKKALKAYEECLAVSNNPDMYVATANWQYITLRKLRKDKEAAELLSTIHAKMDIIENRAYLQILLMYKEKLSMEDYHTLNSISDATTGFGVGNYFLLQDEKEKAIGIFRKILEGNQWSSFGYIAAEAELKRMK